MQKIFYDNYGWVCERYPYDIPIVDENRFIEVSEKTYQRTMYCEAYKAWRVVNGELKEEQYEPVPRDILLIEELSSITNWFRETDYIPHKVVVGDWEPTDERFIQYKAERIKKRTRQDEIDKLLGELL